MMSGALWSSRLAVILLGALAFGTAAQPALAQGRFAVALAAGPSPYDLAGTGTGTAAAALFPWTPLRGLVVEPAAPAAPSS